jgi:hypothetical protein
MTAPETFTVSSKRPLTTGRRPDRTGVRTKAVIDCERQISLHHPAETYVTEHLYCLPKVSSKE